MDDTTYRYPLREDIPVPPEVLDTWQRMLNLISEVFQVPSALIMRVHKEEIEVFLRSESPHNPYEPEERAKLNTGLYCETVMNTNRYLLVPNALADPEWSHNPDIALGMVSYLGFPVLWPTGEVFGTMCVLDRKENRYSETYIRLLEQFKEVLEHDLKLLDADHRLRETEVRLRTMFNSVLDGIFITDPAGHIVEANEVACRTLGCSPEELAGRAILDIIRLPGDWEGDLQSCLASTRRWRGEAEQMRKDGRTFPVDLQMVCMRLGEKEMILTVTHDISERKALEHELNRMASTDNLTGIGNRGAFERALKQEMVQAERYGHPLTLVMLDLDNFKRVNDRFGHETGDRVLLHLCEITTRRLRNADPFFRYGGEEFMILMPETDLEGAFHLAERIRRAVEASPLEPVGKVTVSVGITQYRPGEVRNSLISRVDSALYAAKSKGRNAVSMA